MPNTISQGAEISFEAAGSGPALLLVGGTAYAGSTWHPDFVERLARHNTVLTFDHRGTGKSSGTPSTYTTELFAHDALAVLDAAGFGSAHVLGHSMGGRVAQWMAVLRPEAVISLILAGSGPGAVDGAASCGGIPLTVALGLIEKGFDAFIADLQRRTFFTDEFARTKPAMVHWLFEAFWAARPSIEDYLKHVQARQAHNIRMRVDDIKAPTLIVVGSEDSHIGATGSHVDQSTELSKLIPHSELRILAGLKHGIFWEDIPGSTALVSQWAAEHK